MSILGAYFGTIRKRPVITVSADWGSNTGASPIASATRTLTVPSGSSGVIKFGLTNSGKYSKNAGAFTNIVDNATLSVANGDTLQFNFTSAASDSTTVTVTDNAFGDLIGSWTGTVP